jgi:predicted nucleotide-binding protein (sugar kinase/HSP70/actin superfamily)
LQNILQSIEKDDWKEIKGTLAKSAGMLRMIEKAGPFEEVPVVSLVGEIYVRRDGFSRQYLVERLAREGIMVRTAPVTEWLYYCDYALINKISKATFKERMATVVTQQVKRSYEKEIKYILAQSGLYHVDMIEIDKMLKTIDHLMSPEFDTEALLTTATAFYQAVEETSGVIAIGPFGCLLSRIAEAVITAKLSETKINVARNKQLVAAVMRHHPAIPLLAVETDGNSFPPVTEARLEVFCMQVKRVHRQIMEAKRAQRKGGL